MNDIARLPQSASPVELSVVVPVTGRHDDALVVYTAYRKAMESTGLAFEFIYVLDTAFPQMSTPLRSLQQRGEPITLIELSQRFGEAVCLNVGIERARGDRILMVPPYLQIEPNALPLLIAALGRADLAAAVRDRRADHPLNRLRAAALDQVARLAGSRVRDLGCLVIAARRNVLRETVMQDEHHRFLPLLAQNAGFAVEQLVLPQAQSDRRFRLHAPSVYVGRLFDLVAIAFLLRFMQRPFRFFGSVGAAMALAGTVLGAVLAFERLVLNVPLAERPALLLAMVLLVLGVQVAAVGLIAEIIIFTRANRMATYRVDEVVEQPAAAPVATVTASPTTAVVAAALATASMVPAPGLDGAAAQKSNDVCAEPAAAAPATSET